MTKTNTKNKKEKSEMNRQFEKLVVAILVLIFATMTIAMPVKADTKQVFRLLAVESAFSGALMKSGQYLISNLLNFSNWNNSTDGYVSYIHLLSLFNYSDLFEKCKEYYAGNATKERMHDEVTNFLSTANPGEVAILYYCGDVVPITATELNSWLSMGRLSQANVVVILDFCYSGSWIDDGYGGVLGQGKVVLCSSRSNQSSWSWGSPLSWTWFTGKEKTGHTADQSTWKPLGVIGGFYGANDSNKDNWISMMEDFGFAGPSTEEYASPYGKQQTPVSFNGIGHDIPFVLRTPSQPPVANFTFTPPNPTVNQSITFNATGSNGNITTYSWNFGDGNITSVSQPLINHKYTNAGNYTVTLNVTDNDGLWNTTSSVLNVVFIQVNHDVAITNISLYRSVVSNKTVTSMNVTAQNQGDVQETFTVTLYYNSTAIGSQAITVNSGSLAALSFSWDTTGITIGNYTITASATSMSGETDTADNSLSSQIQVSILGDINGDRRVDMKDVSKVAAGFQATPGQPKWTANGDLDENAVINMKDIGTIAKEFGKIA